MLPRPQTKIFLDSANPQDTQTALKLLGFLDGQTTNPSLIVKVLGENVKVSELEMLEFYKTNVQKIAELIPQGSISIEVYADETTSSEDIYNQAITLKQWIPNAHIKFPTIPNALLAAERFLNEGGRVNFTLVFNQSQALAIHLLANSCKVSRGQVFVSPFVGRLDDIGQNGVDLLKNIQQMYQELNSPVEILGASIRNLNHLQYCLNINLDIVTLPLAIIQHWVEQPSTNYEPQVLTSIPYENLDYSLSWREINIEHPLTTKGLLKFAADWKSCLH